jgi:hypothetical protein
MSDVAEIDAMILIEHCWDSGAPYGQCAQPSRRRAATMTL